jgi:hypothetical protein
MFTNIKNKVIMENKIILILPLIFLLGCDNNKTDNKSNINTTFIHIDLYNKSNNDLSDVCLHTRSNKICKSFIKSQERVIFNLYVYQETPIYLSYDINNKNIYKKENLGGYYTPYLTLQNYINLMIINNVVYRGNFSIEKNKSFNNYNIYDSILTQTKKLNWINKIEQKYIPQNCKVIDNLMYCSD